MFLRQLKLLLPFVFHDVQIIEQACIAFDEIMRQDRLKIDMSVPLEPLSLPAYIEDCRMKLWEHAFSTYFRGHDCYKKSDDFVAFKGTELLVRRVLFRCFILHRSSWTYLSIIWVA
jgi:hypothetical protein